MKLNTQIQIMCINNTTSDAEATETEKERIERETGGVVQTEYGERYAALVLDHSGEKDTPTSV